MTVPQQRLKYSAVLCALLAMLIMLSGCQAVFGAAPTPARSYSGEGPGEVTLEDWEGPAVLRITAPEGSQPFRAETVDGLNYTQLMQSESSVDEYRGVAVEPGAELTLRISGDRAWKVDVFPLGEGSFDTLDLPGTYRGQGNRVILLQEKPGVATFDISRAERLEAWAIGKSQQWERLTITAQGDFQGKAVLPSNTSAIIVSARGPWSVSIATPCCDDIPVKPEN